MPPLAISAGVWAALALATLVVAAVVGRAGWQRFFGPVLYYEVIRAARRGRYFLMRSLYAGGLLLLLLWIWAASDRPSAADRSEGFQQLAEGFFWACAGIQFAAVVLLTPAYVAGCVAEDKERRTLEFLLATDLSGREIVFGKMAARVGNLLMVLLTPLPVMSLIQFIGGIDPNIMLLTFAATGLTVVGLVGVSMAQSVRRRRGRDAILLTYVCAAAYLVISQLLWFLQTVAGAAGGTALAMVFLRAGPAIDVVRWGDPVRVAAEVGRAMSSTGPRGPELLRILGEYAAFHGIVFAAGLAYAVARLRPLALAQAGRGDGAKRRRGRRSRRPAVSVTRPMVWKEVYAEGTLRVGRFGRFGLNLIIGLGFVPLGVIAYSALFDPSSGVMSWDLANESINAWVRSMNAIVGSLMLVGIAVRAAGSVGGERDRDTLTSLLTTPMSAREILGGKAWGALASVRTVVYWLVAVWAIGIITASVNPFALLVWAASAVPPACAAAACGLFCSVACRTTLRAILATVLAMVFGLGGHWALGCLCCYIPIGRGSSGDFLKPIVAFQTGATPPAVFAIVPVRLNENWPPSDEIGTYVLIGALGTLSWLAVAGFLGSAALRRFAAATNRAGPVAPGRPPVEAAA